MVSISYPVEIEQSANSGVEFASLTVKFDRSAVMAARVDALSWASRGAPAGSESKSAAAVAVVVRVSGERLPPGPSWENP